MNKNNLRFIFFCIGISVAMSSSLIFLFILCLNLNGIETLTFEHDPLIAMVEMWLLIMAVATCAVASEIYYKYLQIKAR
jgi:hypothetical protein